uniref:Uncharacterized protein n=1 Tax=Oryza brachyantha TaxID=4533 RepID=J3MSR3_ORYBR
RQGSVGGGGTGVCGGELQTAVVRYEKRFPWSILHPFLHVSLLTEATWHRVSPNHGDFSQRDEYKFCAIPAANCNSLLTVSAC